MDSQGEKRSVVKGHHVYKNIWAPFTGEQLSLQAEEDNEHDKYAVAVLKDDYVVGHVPRLSVGQLTFPSGCTILEFFEDQQKIPSQLPPSTFFLLQLRSFSCASRNCECSVT